MTVSQILCRLLVCGAEILYKKCSTINGGNVFCCALKKLLCMPFESLHVKMFYLQCRPLIYAAAGGNERVASLLLTYGANVNQQDKDRSTALIQACLCNHTALAKMFVMKGADVNKADKVSDYNSQLH